MWSLFGGSTIKASKVCVLMCLCVQNELAYRVAMCMHISYVCRLNIVSDCDWSDSTVIRTESPLQRCLRGKQRRQELWWWISNNLHNEPGVNQNIHAIHKERATAWQRGSKSTGHVLVQTKQITTLTIVLWWMGLQSKVLVMEVKHQKKWTL